MAVTSIPAVSVEFVHVPVTASVSLNTQVVEMAFLADTATPTEATTWVAAEWEGSAALTRTCRVLTGPGTGTVLTVGKVNVWVRVTDSPEIPVRNAGQLTVI